LSRRAKPLPSILAQPGAWTPKAASALSLQPNNKNSFNRLLFSPAKNSAINEGGK
jgi:hypothetical protein